MTENIYGGITDRVKAVIVDSLVIIIFMFIIANVFSAFETVHNIVRIAAFIFVFLIYDPFFTSVFGGTIGHFVFGIRIKRERNHNRNISFPMAIIRYVVKALLGWISLLTVTGNEKRKAIHDYIVGSVVLYKNR